VSILFLFGFCKFPITRILVGHDLCIFLVALCRFCMLLSARFHDAEVINCCYVLKAGEIWGLGMGNTSNVIVSLAYFRFIKKAWLLELKIYKIGKDSAAWVTFVLLFLFCTTSTAVCLSYAGGMHVDEGYCLAIGANQTENNKLFVIWYALCLCVPSLFAIAFFFAGMRYLRLYFNRCESMGGFNSGWEFVLTHLKNIQIAQAFLNISWFLSNFFCIFWLIYYQQTNDSPNYKEYYLASAQFTTIQNFTDFIVNLNFFILPRMGYSGVTEFLTTCCMCADAASEESATSENCSRANRRTTSTKISISRASILTDTTLGTELNEFLLETSSNF
jgi:hypothetical protein